jgi:hypothetical protein
MSCTQPNLSSGYLNTVNSQGWSFEFIWVGPQAPGTGYAHQFSSTPSTAYTQGQNEASSAYNKLLSLGIGNSAANTAIVYDLDAVNTTYQSAVNSFISGWINILHISPAQKAGVYGSVCGSNLNALRNLSPYPDFIWGAYYNGNPSTSNLYTGTCGVTSGNWINHQRLKQYNNTHNETWGGVTLSVDDDCANGPTDPTGVGTDTACE